MIFGAVPVAEALGAILAHSLSLNSRTFRKGSVLDAQMIEAITTDGIDEVVVARLEKGELAENTAAERVGKALVGSSLKIGPVFTGRVNLLAEKAGLVRVDPQAVAAFNAVDEGLTLATLPDLMRVEVDQLVATVKVIPYGISSFLVEMGLKALGRHVITLHPFMGGTARLILTRTEGFKESLLAKGESVVADRATSLGYQMAEAVVVPHQEVAIAEALSEDADLHLILGASATSDRADVAPSAVEHAGGRIDRFGMPVDPGNLLFLGELRGAPVVGLPGCARSPALNGVDWVLERLAAGIGVDGDAVAAMGVGGLLKEMPGRPQPRRPR
ncbi:MAG: molybdopterin-binding protein [Silicimonas sp.]|nr:molybdopterin-binding protein [Silicimonas sp.]